jgi:hypothetical protein
MSRRYGRNQKRRAREALEQATQDAQRFKNAWHMESALLQSVAAQKRELAQIVDDIRDCLPNGSALLPPGLLRVDIRSPDPRDRLMVASEPPGLTGAIEEEQCVSFTEVEAHPLVCSIDTDRFSGAVHFNAKFMDGSEVYCASRETISSLPRDRLIRLLRDDISRQLSIALVDKLRQGRLS